MQSAKIVALSVLVCVVYGVLHDQITARVCIEYFTIGHATVLPPELETPTLLGLAWGVIATWWVGVILGVPLAIASRVGGLPKRDARSLLRPLLIVAACSAAAALAFGFAGWVVADAYEISLPPRLDELVPPEKHPAFIADFCAHNASYASGFVGGVILIGSTLRWRWRRNLESKVDKPGA